MNTLIIRNGDEFQKHLEDMLGAAADSNIDCLQVISALQANLVLLMCQFGMNEDHVMESMRFAFQQTMKKSQPVVMH
jgi:hypothetical protein